MGTTLGPVQSITGRRSIWTDWVEALLRSPVKSPLQSNWQCLESRVFTRQSTWVRHAAWQESDRSPIAITENLGIAVRRDNSNLRRTDTGILGSTIGRRIKRVCRDGVRSGARRCDQPELSPACPLNSTDQWAVGYMRATSTRMPPAVPASSSPVIQFRGSVTFLIFKPGNRRLVCIHIFSPGKRLELDYVAESKTLDRGEAEDIIELLITNHSPSREDINRIHIVYPHGLPAFPKTAPRDQRTFEDITPTWIEPESNHNRMYRSNGGPRVTPNPGGGYLVSASIRDPKNPTQVISYDGVVRGDVELTRFQPENAAILNDEEWEVLSLLEWSIFTLHLQAPLHYEEARWLRVLGRGGTEPKNRRGVLKNWYYLLTDQLVDTFKIEGPLDVRDKLAADLRSVDEFYPNLLSNRMKLKLSDVIDKTLINGIEARGTETVIPDWRINILWNGYTRVPGPVASGDVTAAGVERLVVHSDGTKAPCHQFKAGAKNINPPTAGGKFVIDITAICSPFPGLALSLAIISLILTLLDLLGKLRPISNFLRKLFP